MDQLPWVTFCISTYQRPVLLEMQLAHLLKQTFPGFEVVISDNDPAGSAREVAASFNDSRIRYFHNEENLGMMKSFNKSIDRAATDYIVMVTDDDPIEIDFLSDIRQLYVQHPGYSLYGGFKRKRARPGQLEIIPKDRFISESLDFQKTPDILWSSCVIKKQAALAVGKIPDYGSPHLADHALVAMSGSIEGGVIVNRMYSTLTKHDSNFSKFNFTYYTSGCKGFYEVMTQFCMDRENFDVNKAVILKQIYRWFISNIFTLKRYHTIANNPKALHEVNECARQILAFPFMRKVALRLYMKNFVFYLKKVFHLLK